MRSLTEFGGRRDRRRPFCPPLPSPPPPPLPCAAAAGLPPSPHAAAAHCAKPRLSYLACGFICVGWGDSRRLAPACARCGRIWPPSPVSISACATRARLCDPARPPALDLPPVLTAASSAPLALQALLFASFPATSAVSAPAVPAETTAAQLGPLVSLRRPALLPSAPTSTADRISLPPRNATS